MAQNAYLQKMMKNKKFAAELAEQFSNGLRGKHPGRVKQFLSGFKGATTVPEITMLKEHIFDMGDKMRRNLVEQGITKIDESQVNLIKNVTQGRFSQLSKIKLDDKSEKILGSLGEQVGLPGMNWRGLMEHPDAVQHLKKLEDTWQRKDLPLLSNVVSGLGEKITPGMEMATDVARTKHGASLAGSSVGGAVLGAVEPATAAMNTSKLVMSNPYAREKMAKNKYVKKGLDWADKTFVQKPIESGYKVGTEGKDRGKVKKFVETYGLNALTSQLSQVGNVGGQIQKDVVDKYSKFFKG